MTWLYRFRFLKHWFRFFMTVDESDAWECQHYFHSKRPNDQA